jgi:hypothetical protein
MARQDRDKRGHVINRDRLPRRNFAKLATVIGYGYRVPAKLSSAIHDD